MPGRRRRLRQRCTGACDRRGTRSTGSEVIKRRAVEYRGSDAGGDGRRRHPRPQPASRRLVDELPTRTLRVPRNPDAWQDVEELLASGIDVISTLNIQHLESLNDVVERITGAKAARDHPGCGSFGRPSAIELRRHVAGGAAPAHGPRQHLQSRNGSTRRSPTYFRPGNLRRCGARAAVGARTVSTKRWASDRERHGITEPWETEERRSSRSPARREPKH